MLNNPCIYTVYVAIESDTIIMNQQCRSMPVASFSAAIRIHSTHTHTHIHIHTYIHP